MELSRKKPDDKFHFIQHFTKGGYELHPYLPSKDSKRVDVTSRCGFCIMGPPSLSVDEFRGCAVGRSIRIGRWCGGQDERRP